MHFKTQTVTNNDQCDLMASGGSKYFNILWLDSNANQSEENLLTQQSLYRAFDNVEIFEDENECQQFIQSKPEEEFFIIISGRLSRTVIPTIHEFRQVTVIYIFCFDKSSYEEWSRQYDKVIVLTFFSSIFTFSLRSMLLLLI